MSLYIDVTFADDEEANLSAHKSDKESEESEVYLKLLLILKHTNPLVTGIKYLRRKSDNSYFCSQKRRRLKPVG